MATDNFTGSDGTLLNTHDSLWDTMSGGVVDNGEIFSNFLRPAGDWLTCAAFYNNGQPADQESQAVFLATTAQRYYRYIIARASASSQGYAAYFSEASGSNYTWITIMKNGAWFGDRSGSWAYASNHTVKIKVYGTSTTSIEVWVDGVQVGSTLTDSTSPITSGNPGFKIGGDGTREHAIDDWTDNIAAGGGGGAKIPYALKPALII